MAVRHRSVQAQLSVPSQIHTVVIEPLRVDHAAVLFPVLQAAKIYAFLDHGPPESLQALTQRYEFMLNPASPPAGERWLNWCVIAHGEAPATAGTVQATIDEPNQAAEVAWVLGPEFWGQGIASRAVDSMFRELATTYGVEHVVAQVDPRNLASIALAERLGFAQRAEPAADSDDLLFDRALTT